MTRNRRTSVAKSILSRTLLLLGGLTVALALAELLLLLIDRPHFHKPPDKTPQFKITDRQDADFLVYTSLPSNRIRFRYDDNPRRYFGPENEVDHLTNTWGFRGPEFQSAKTPQTLRVAFLGDSFTFGEGVRFEDTYPELVARLLPKRLPGAPIRVESCNFAVGGYNTTHELYALRNSVLQTKPDIIVLAYTLNDAETPIFEFNPKGREFRPVERRTGEQIGPLRPPESWLFKLRFPQLLWQHFTVRQRNQRWKDYYTSLYDDQAAGWIKTRESLRNIAAVCRDADIPLFILRFPLLFELNDRYPFLSVHEKLRREVEATGAPSIDLLPSLKGLQAEDLWVHATDQHPNEKVHRIAADALIELLMHDPRFSQQAEKIAREH